MKIVAFLFLTDNFFFLKISYIFNYVYSAIKKTDLMMPGTFNNSIIQNLCKSNNLTTYMKEQGNIIVSFLKTNNIFVVFEV